jgi:hypothetical protein
MATSTAVVSTATSAIIPSSPSFSGLSIGNSITVHLSRNNFFLWRAQATLVLRGHQLFGYVNNSIKAPTKTEGPKRRPEGGVNGSQSKFLTEFGLYPKINPKPQHAKSSSA